MKNCMNCGNQLMDETKMCTRCGAIQTPKKSKTPIIIGIIVAFLLFFGLICFTLIVGIRMFLDSTIFITDSMVTEEGETDLDYQKYEDNYLSYEIPLTWEPNDSLTDDSINLTGFGPSSSTTDKPSNINITINSFENGAKLANVDFSDKEIKKAFRVFLLSQVGTELPKEAADGEFSSIMIGEHYVYTLSYDRTVGDTIVHQKIYFPMDYDYTITIYATDWLDGEQPSANQVAEHLIETLEVK